MIFIREKDRNNKKCLKIVTFNYIVIGFISFNDVAKEYQFYPSKNTYFKYDALIEINKRIKFLNGKK